MAHYYAEVAVSSPAVTETIASTHCNYSRRDGQAECAWVAWKYGDGIPATGGHRSQY